MISSLTIEHLACVRGDRTLFRDLSLAVRPGEIVGIAGPNGAGKTSLLRLVAGFLAPAAGRVRVGEAEEAEERGRLVGWLGHQDGLKSQLSVGEQLGFYAALYGARMDETVLKRVGLARQRDLLCRYLSAGQKKRVALARLILCVRPLWLLDEPFAALDAAGRGLMGDLLADHAAKGGIALVATHETLGHRMFNLGHQGAP